MKSKKFKMRKADWMRVLHVFIYSVLAFILTVLPTITLWPTDFHGWYLLFWPIFIPAIQLVASWLKTSEGTLTSVFKAEPEKKANPDEPIQEP
jgi:hypothetical protein